MPRELASSAERLRDGSEISGGDRHRHANGAQHLLASADRSLREGVQQLPLYALQDREIFD